MRKLRVIFEVPVQADHPPLLEPTIQFHGWLPMRDEAIDLTIDEIDIKIYFKLSSIYSFVEKERHIKEDSMITVKDIIFELSKDNVSETMYDYLMNLDPQAKRENSQISQEYEKLGMLFNRTIVTCYDKIINYVRSEKGQYWLSVFIGRLDDELFYSKATFDDNHWFRWQPLQKITTTLYVNDIIQSMDRNSWAHLHKHLSSLNHRAWPVGILLSDARKLHQGGYYRSALIEACVALELAIGRFFEKPLLTKLPDLDRIKSIDLPGIRSKLNELGMRIATKLLLPLVFPKNIMSTDQIVLLQNAIDERNRIVHAGRLVLDKKIIRKYVMNITRVCIILRQYTEK